MKTTNLIEIELSSLKDVVKVIEAINKLRLHEKNDGAISIRHYEITRHLKFAMSAPDPKRDEKPKTRTIKVAPIKS